MRRALVLIAASVFVAVACVPGASSASPTAAKTADIKRTKLDIAYSGFVDDDYHHVTSKKALEAALEGVRGVVRKAGGKDDIATPAFQDVDQPQTTDFNKFADAVTQLAGRVQVSADQLADAAITSMLSASPDCHTYYVSANGNVFHSLPFAPKGTNALVPTQGTTLGGPDEAGLTGKMLPGGIAYITFHAWINTGTYHLGDTFRAMLDKAVAQGAKAWLFDMRGNLGGFPTDLSSFFLNGEPTRTHLLKNGNGGTSSGNKGLRLPEAYQLPMVVIANDRTASGSEHFILDLKEANRMTLVGQKTTGCLGEADEFRAPDNAQFSIVVQEVTGGTTGAHYNNVGIPPDVPAADATAVDKAIEILKGKI
jgi:C-terminal processing protease CtpA/Prc